MTKKQNQFTNQSNLLINSSIILNNIEKNLLKKGQYKKSNKRTLEFLTRFKTEYKINLELLFNETLPTLIPFLTLVIKKSKKKEIRKAKYITKKEGIQIIFKWLVNAISDKNYKDIDMLFKELTNILKKRGIFYQKKMDQYKECAKTLFFAN